MFFLTNSIDFQFFKQFSKNIQPSKSLKITYNSITNAQGSELSKYDNEINISLKILLSGMGKMISRNCIISKLINISTEKLSILSVSRFNLIQHFFVLVNYIIINLKSPQKIIHLCVNWLIADQFRAELLYLQIKSNERESRP